MYTHSAKHQNSATTTIGDNTHFIQVRRDDATVEEDGVFSFEMNIITHLTLYYMRSVQKGKNGRVS